VSIREELAEFIGTFTLVFIGAGAMALVVSGASPGGLVGVALAHGLALVVIVYAWGAVSGGHVNPAVTFGLALTGRFPWVRAVRYWIAQLLGAVAASYLLLVLIGRQGDLGMTMPSASVSPWQAIVIEAVLTFFLVTAVFASAVAGRNGNGAALAIGLVLTMDILMGGVLTGASMNPARSFGPALVMGNLGDLYIYFIGPLLGGGVAALLYDRVFLRGAEPTGT
jgi:MIP family channel proteins